MKFTPRLYVDAALEAGATLPLTDTHFNYLARVLRLQNGAEILLFNGTQGEWLATCQFEKRGGAALCHHQTRPQPAPAAQRILAISILKPDKMELVAEKATELGATHLQPLLCDHTQTKQVNARRLTAHMVEAAEQCERLTLPTLLPPLPLHNFLANTACPVLAALERVEAPAPAVLPMGNIALLVGPEGGFSDAEKTALLGNTNLTPINLGPSILRAETAAIVMLGLCATKL